MGAQVVIAVDVAATADGSFIGWAGGHRWVPGKLTQTLRALEDTMGTLVMAAEERKLCEHPPDVLIRPATPPGAGVLTGYHRVAELTACGESAAQAALPQIGAALGRPPRRGVPHPRDIRPPQGGPWPIRGRPTRGAHVLRQALGARKRITSAHVMLRHP